MFLRLFYSTFRIEVNRFASTVPIVSSVVEILLSFFALLMGVGFVAKITGESSTAGRGGILGLVVGLVFIAFVCATLVSFVAAFVFGITAFIALLLAYKNLLVFWILISFLGFLLKRSSKIQLIANKRDSLIFPKLYIFGFLASIPLAVFLLKFILDRNLLGANDAELIQSNPVFLGIGFVFGVIFIFHAFVKPFINSLIIISIKFFIRATKEEAELIDAKLLDRNTKFLKFRNKLLTFRSVILTIVALIYLLFYSLINVSSLADMFRGLFFPLDILFVKNLVNFHAAFFVLCLISWFIFSCILTPEESFFARLLKRFSIQSKLLNFSFIFLGLLSVILLSFFMPDLRPKEEASLSKYIYDISHLYGTQEGDISNFIETNKDYILTYKAYPSSRSLEERFERSGGDLARADSLIESKAKSIYKATERKSKELLNMISGFSVFVILLGVISIQIRQFLKYLVLPLSFILLLLILVYPRNFCMEGYQECYESFMEFDLL